MTKVKKTIITAICIALCVVLPQAFHAIPNAGAIYLPMHIPVLLSGLICGWSYGLICGIAGPVLSMLFTGMPPVAILPAMVIECAVYGCVSGVMMRIVNFKDLYGRLYVSQIAAMFLGRVAAGACKAFIFMPGKFGLTAWISSHFILGLPGIIIQLALIPSIIYALSKAHLISCNKKPSGAIEHE